MYKIKQFLRAAIERIFIQHPQQPVSLKFIIQDLTLTIPQLIKSNPPNAHVIDSTADQKQVIKYVQSSLQQALKLTTQQRFILGQPDIPVYYQQFLKFLDDVFNNVSNAQIIDFLYTQLGIEGVFQSVQKEQQLFSIQMLLQLLKKRTELGKKINIDPVIFKIFETYYPNKDEIQKFNALDTKQLQKYNNILQNYLFQRQNQLKAAKTIQQKRNISNFWDTKFHQIKSQLFNDKRLKKVARDEIQQSWFKANINQYRKRYRQLNQQQIRNIMARDFNVNHQMINNKWMISSQAQPILRTKYQLFIQKLQKQIERRRFISPLVVGKIGQILDDQQHINNFEQLRIMNDIIDFYEGIGQQPEEQRIQVLRQSNYPLYQFITQLLVQKKRLEKTDINRYLNLVDRIKRQKAKYRIEGSKAPNYADTKISQIITQQQQSQPIDIKTAIQELQQIRQQQRKKLQLYNARIAQAKKRGDKAIRQAQIQQQVNRQMKDMKFPKTYHYIQKGIKDRVRIGSRKHKQLREIDKQIKFYQDFHNDQLQQRDYARVYQIFRQIGIQNPDQILGLYQGDFIENTLIQKVMQTQASERGWFFHPFANQVAFSNLYTEQQFKNVTQLDKPFIFLLHQVNHFIPVIYYPNNHEVVMYNSFFPQGQSRQSTRLKWIQKLKNSIIFDNIKAVLKLRGQRDPKLIYQQGVQQIENECGALAALYPFRANVEDLQIRQQFIRSLTNNRLNKMPANRRQFQKYIRHIYNMRKRQKIGSQIKNIPEDTAIDTQEYSNVQNLYQRLSQLSNDIKQHHQFNSIYKAQMNQLLIEMQTSINAKQMYSNTNRGRQMRAQQNRIVQMRLAYQATQRQYQASLSKVNQLMKKQQDLSNNLQIKMKMLQDLNKRQNNQQIIQKQQQRILQLNKVIQQIRRQFIILKPQNQMYRNRISQMTKQLNALKTSDSRKITQLIQATQNQLSNLEIQWKNKFNQMISQKQVQIQRQLTQQRRQSQIKYQDLLNLLRQKQQQLAILKSNPPTSSNTHAQALYVYNQGLQKIRQMEKQRDNIVIQAQLRLRAIQSLQNQHSEDIQRIKNQQIMLVQQVQFAIRNNVDINRPGFDKINKWIKQLNQDKLKVQTQVQNFRINQLQKYQKEIQFYKGQTQSRDKQVKQLINAKVQSQKQKLKQYYQKLIKAKQQKINKLEKDKDLQIKELKQKIQKTILQTAQQKNKIIQDNKKSNLSLKLQKLNKQIVQLRTQLSNRQLELNKMRFQAGQIVQIKKDKQVIDNMWSNAKDQIQQLQKKLNSLQIQYQLKKNSQAKQSQQIKRITEQNNLKALANQQLQVKIKQKQLQAAKTTQKIVQLNEQVKKANRAKQTALRKYEKIQQQLELYEKAKSLMVSQGVGIQQAYAKLSEGSQTDHPLLQLYKPPSFNVQGRKLTISKLVNVQQRKLNPSTQLIQTQLQYKKMLIQQQKIRKQAKNAKQILNNYKTKITKAYMILNDSTIKAQVRKKSIKALTQQIQIYKDDQLARMFQLSLDLKEQQQLYNNLKSKNQSDLQQLEAIKVKASIQKQRLQRQLKQKNDRAQKEIADIRLQNSILQKKWLLQKQAHYRQIEQMKMKQKLATSILQAQIKRVQKRLQQDNANIDKVTQYAKKLQKKMEQQQQKIRNQQKLLKQKEQLNKQISAQNKQYLQKYQKLKEEKRQIMIQRDKYLASRNQQQARITAMKQQNNRQMKDTLQQLKASKQSANIIQKSLDSLKKTNLQLNVSKQLSQKEKVQLKLNLQNRVKKMQSQSKLLQQNLNKQKLKLQSQKNRASTLQLQLKESNRKSNEKFQQIIDQHKRQIERLKDIEQLSRASEMQARKNALKLFKAQNYQYKAIIKNMQYYKTDNIEIPSTTQSKLKRLQRQLKQQVQKGQNLSSSLKQLTRKLEISQKKLNFQSNKVIVAKKQYQQLKQLYEKANNTLIPQLVLQNQIYKNIFQIEQARKKIESVKNLTMKNLHNQNKQWRQKYEQMRKNQTRQMQELYQQIEKATAQKMKSGNQTIMRLRRINLQNLLNAAKQRSEFYKKYFQDLQRLKVYTQQQEMPIQQIIRIEAQKIISQKVTQKLKQAIPQAYYQTQQGKRVAKQLQQLARKQKVSNERINSLNQQMKQKNRIIQRLRIQLNKAKKQMQNIKQIHQWNQVQLTKNLTIQGKQKLRDIQTKMRIARKMRNRLGYRTNAIYKNHILRQITRKMRFLGRLDITSNKSPQMLGLAMQSILQQLRPFYSSKISQGIIYGLAQRFLHVTSYVKYIVAKNKKKKMFKTFFDIFLKKIAQVVIGVDLKIVQKNWQLYYQLFMNYDHSPILMHQGNRKQWNSRYKVHLNSWMQKMINKLSPGNLPLNSVSVQVNKSQEGQWQVQMTQLQSLVGRIIGNIQMQYNAFEGVKPKQIQETGIDYTISIILGNQNGNRITIPIRVKFLKQIDPKQVLERIKKALKVILGKDQYQGFIQWFVEQIKFKNNIDLHTIVQDMYEDKIPQNIRDFLTYQTFQPHYNYLMYNKHYNYQLSCYENILVYIQKTQNVKLVRTQYGQLSYLQQLANKGYFGLVYKSLKLVEHSYLYCVVSACQRIEGVNLVKDHVFLTDKIVQWSNIMQQDKKMIMKPQFVKKSFKANKEQPKYHKMYLDIQCFSDLYTRNREEAIIQQIYLIGVNYIVQDQQQDTVQFIIPQGDQPLAQRRQIMIRDFVTWFQKIILRYPNNWDIWAYNGINYDYQYIIPQLLQHVFSKAKVLGTKICPKAYLIKQDQLLVRFLDTKTIITTGSLKKNSQKYNKQYKKLQLNIAQISSQQLMKRYQKQILEYNRHDCLAMRQLLQSHYDQLWIYVQQCAKKYKRSKAIDKIQFYNKWTIPSMAFYLFQRVFLSSNILPDTKYFQIHKFNYFGGCTQVWKHITQQPLYQLDINSQYPSVMYQQQHPIYLFGQIQIDSHEKLQQQIDLIKNGFRDSYFYKIQYFQLYGLACTIGISTNKSLIYPKSYRWIQTQRQRWIWGVQLKPHIKNGAVFIISKALAYRGVNQRGQRWQSFQNYVQQAYSYRLKAKAQKNDLMDNIAKCFQNSLYGKLAQKKFQKLQIEWNDGYNVYQSDEKQRHGFQVGRFIRMASYITSSARSKLTSFIYSAGVQNVWYMDTDSIYTNQEGYINMKKDGLLHQKELGLMKCQRRLSKAFFIAKKMYVGQVDYKWMYQNNYISKQYYLKNELLRWSMKSKGINVNQSQTDIQLLYYKARQMYKVARWVWLSKPSLTKVLCIMKFDTVLWQKQKNQRYGVKRMLVNKKVNFIFQRQPLENGQTTPLDYDFVRQIIKNKSNLTQDQFRSIPYQFLHLFEQLN